MLLRAGNLTTDWLKLVLRGWRDEHGIWLHLVIGKELYIPCPKGFGTKVYIEGLGGGGGNDPI